MIQLNKRIDNFMSGISSFPRIHISFDEKVKFQRFQLGSNPEQLRLDGNSSKTGQPKVDGQRAINFVQVPFGDGQRDSILLAGSTEIAEQGPFFIVDELERHAKPKTGKSVELGSSFVFV